jgi:hypothetical protein
MRFTWLVLALFLALACAAPRTAPTLPPAETAPASEPAPIAAPIAPPVARGMDAGEVRRALGAPARVEKVDSAAAKGSRYERWIYADRVVVLLDGKVVDVLP